MTGVDESKTGMEMPETNLPGVDAEEILAHRAEFPAMEPQRMPNPGGSLSRFFDVTVTVSVELGRVTLPIGELVKLGKGSVVELDRAIDQPVDLMAQGVRLARGEVIVVNDRYAIRIDEIESQESAGVRRNSSAVKRSTASAAGVE
ncbi:MAG: flagellar motor switch protein FliN [Planctomycetaceae bacterium]|nr:flagellar motor switch protein FliN [Planctomycetaceae bacterium]